MNKKEYSGIIPFFRIEERGEFQRDSIPLAKEYLVTKLDRETKDFAHLINEEIIADDGNIYICYSIERFAHCEPWHEGEKICLVVGEAQ